MKNRLVVALRASRFLAAPAVALWGCATYPPPEIPLCTYSDEQLRQLTFADIERCGRVFSDLYTIDTSRDLRFEKHTIVLDAYKWRDEARRYRYDQNLPDAVMVVHSGRQRTMLPMRVSDFARDSRYTIVNAPESALCISNAGGGNAWRANPWHVLSLAHRTFLKKLGEVDGVADRGKIGAKRLLVFEDVWEIRLPWFGHANSPWAETFYRVRNGVLEPDAEANAVHWRTEITRLNAEIEQERPAGKEANDISSCKNEFEMGSPLLRAILDKYLNQRLLEGHDKAWAELQKELRHSDAEYFYFHPFEPREKTLVKCHIRDIEAPLLDTLKARGYLPP